MPQYRIHNGQRILTVAIPELIECGVSENYLKRALSGNRSGELTCWPHHKEGNTIYLHFDGLKEEYKLKIQLVLCGGVDPHETGRFERIEELLQVPMADVEHIQNYRYGAKDFYLPTEVQVKYKAACGVLAMLVQYEGKKTIESTFGMPVPEFYDTVIAYIKKNDIALPTSYTKLRERVRAYKAFGPSVVISSHYGNQRSCKVRDELSEAVLIKMIAHHNQFDDEYVAKRYNEYVQINNIIGSTGQLLTITAQTVGRWRKNNDFDIRSERYGAESWYNKYGPQIKRDRPSAPLLLVNSDDNDLDLYFQKQEIQRDGTMKTKYYHRFKLYVVFDGFNNYPLGYSFGNEVSIELVKEAYRNAIDHIRELTGEYFVYQQVVSDRWSLKALGPWLNAHAHLTPISLGNKRSNYAESNFSQRWHSVLKRFKGYSGHNVTSKSHIDRNAFERNKKDFYHVDQAAEVIAAFIESLRNYTNDKTGKTIRQEWVEAWNNTDLSKKKALPAARRIEMFGYRRIEMNEITNGGVALRIDGETFRYQLQAADYSQYVGMRGHIMFDPANMHQVLWVSPDEKIKVLASAADLMPSALADFNEGDRMRLNAKMAEKKTIAMLPASRMAQRQQALDRANIDAQSMLQSGVLIKELKHEAERIALAPVNESDEPDIYERLYDQTADTMLKTNDED